MKKADNTQPSEDLQSWHCDKLNRDFPVYRPGFSVPSSTQRGIPQSHPDHFLHEPESNPDDRSVPWADGACPGPPSKEGNHSSAQQSRVAASSEGHSSQNQCFVYARHDKRPLRPETGYATRARDDGSEPFSEGVSVGRGLQPCVCTVVEYPTETVYSSTEHGAISFVFFLDIHSRKCIYVHAKCHH